MNLYALIFKILFFYFKKISKLDKYTFTGKLIKCFYQCFYIKPP